MGPGNCIICGGALVWKDVECVCMVTGRHLCQRKECEELAIEYGEKRSALYNKFAEEKALVLNPLLSKFDADIHSLEMGYLKGKEWSRKELCGDAVAEKMR